LEGEFREKRMFSKIVFGGRERSPQRSIPGVTKPGSSIFAKRGNNSCVPCFATPQAICGEMAPPGIPKNRPFQLKMFPP
jgi:hypothetical protein